jgi:hypothetical protein
MSSAEVGETGELSQPGTQRPVVHEFLRRFSEQAQRALRGVNNPGVLQISRLHPTDSKLVPSRYRITDVERMVEDAITHSDAGHNVYIEGRTVRADLRGSARGKLEDTAGVFALVIDSDADKGMAWTPPEPVSMTVETSPGNAHHWLFFDQAISAQEAKELGEHIRSSTGADHDSGNPTQPYRIAGTNNYPSPKKQTRGRITTPTRMLSTADRLWTPEQILKAFPLPERKTTNGGGHSHSSDEAAIPDDLMEVIRDGVEIGKRSEDFFHVVEQLKLRGWTVGGITELLEKHPGGIAAKYAGRIPGEVGRVYDKVEERVVRNIGGAATADEPPAAMSPGEYGVVPQPRRVDLSTVPLTIREWRDRELPEPDCLMGAWFTTTSRVLLSAPTGIGKTNFLMATAAHIAAGRDFLHWPAHRLARVLYVDGEMSNRLLKRRVHDVCRRFGSEPEGLFLFSHEDIEGFQPLNTPAAKALIERLIEERIGAIDAIIFDNVMALIAGDMKEEEGWQRALPLVDALTKRGIGQIWAHHTGHDTTRSYGTKTREWRMDTVIHLTEEKRVDTDVSFHLEFQKARERTPETRRDFEEVTIALVADEWICSAATLKRGKPAPLELKFLEALHDALAGDGTTKYQTWNAVKAEQWRAECFRRGLLDQAKLVSARTLFNRYRRDLIAHNLIACDGELVWLR